MIFPSLSEILHYIDKGTMTDFVPYNEILSFKMSDHSLLSERINYRSLIVA